MVIESEMASPHEPNSAIPLARIAQRSFAVARDDVLAATAVGLAVITLALVRLFHGKADRKKGDNG